MSCADRNPRLSGGGRQAESFHGRSLPLPPSKHVAVVACMDARLNVYGLLGLHDGEAHVIRTPAWASEAFTDLDEDVRRSIARITSSPFVPHTDQVRGVRVRRGDWQAQRGRLRLRPGVGRCGAPAPTLAAPRSLTVRAARSPPPRRQHRRR
jgi:carbonic anhydrase